MRLKERILHESLKLFSLKGFNATSIQDILEAAGTSKGGLYNHFKSKEDLFMQSLDEARKIWRDQNLMGLDRIRNPIDKIIKLLENFRDLYLKDAKNFPGGCVFITFAVELSDHHPHLAQEVGKGFDGLKRMIKRLLEEGKASDRLKMEVDSVRVTEILFLGILGASITYLMDKSSENLQTSMGALIEFIENLKS